MGDNDDTQRRILVDILKNPSVEAKELPFSLLVDITANFSAGRELGRGTYGTVYKVFFFFCEEGVIFFIYPNEGIYS
jgi:hypothetical protein